MFGCTKRMQQVGKYRFTYLTYTGKQSRAPLPAPGTAAFASRYHEAKPAPVPGAPAVTSVYNEAATGMRDRRRAMLKAHLSDRGYTVKAYMGRWLAAAENGPVVRLDRKVIERIVSDMVDAGECRTMTIDTATQGHISNRSVPHTILFDPTFPEATPEMLASIVDEIKQTDMAMRLDFWQKDKDVYNIWPPDKPQRVEALAPAPGADADADADAETAGVWGDVLGGVVGGSTRITRSTRGGGGGGDG
eukprot:CAMPEP_0197584866 /NCGR_PEP_ID=MMETSP1326-20131121/7350_1 /TAXON_ID=1155430 /ORGANISM="Genus nov. species nov., Strain RCC2288" /LENGTH=246 /DNA_ID=CAMNT_0043149291 /DNA_START=56 /DNA_END=793 /DNA_ORIENTATION=-